MSGDVQAAKCSERGQSVQGSVAVAVSGFISDQTGFANHRDGRRLSRRRSPVKSTASDEETTFAPDHLTRRRRRLHQQQHPRSVSESLGPRVVIDKIVHGMSSIVNGGATQTDSVTASDTTGGSTSSDSGPTPTDSGSSSSETQSMISASSVETVSRASTESQASISSMAVSSLLAGPTVTTAVSLTPAPTTLIPQPSSGLIQIFPIFSASANVTSSFTSVLVTTTATVDGHLTTFQTLVPTALSPFTSSHNPQLSHQGIAGTLIGAILGSTFLALVGFLFWRRMAHIQRERLHQRNLSTSSPWRRRDDSGMRRVLDDEVDEDFTRSPQSRDRTNGGGPSMYGSTPMTEDTQHSGGSGIVRARTMEKPYEYGAIGSASGQGSYGKRTMSSSSGSAFHFDSHPPALPMDTNSQIISTGDYVFQPPPESTPTFNVAEQDPSAIRAFRAKRTGSGSGSIFREDFGDADRASVIEDDDALRNRLSRSTYPTPPNSGIPSRWSSGIIIPQTLPSPRPSIGASSVSGSQFMEGQSTRGGGGSWVDHPYSTTINSRSALLHNDSVGSIELRPQKSRDDVGTMSRLSSTSWDSAYDGIEAADITHFNQKGTSEQASGLTHRYPPDAPASLDTSKTAPLMTPTILTTSPTAITAGPFDSSSRTAPSRGLARSSTSSISMERRGSTSPHPYRDRRRLSSGSLPSFSPSSRRNISPTSGQSPAPLPPGAAALPGPQEREADRVDEHFKIYDRTARAGQQQQQQQHRQTSTEFVGAPTAKSPRTRPDSYVIPAVPVKGDGSLRGDDSPPRRAQSRRGSSGSLASYMSADEA